MAESHGRSGAERSTTRKSLIVHGQTNLLKDLTAVEDACSHPGNCSTISRANATCPRSWGSPSRVATGAYFIRIGEQAVLALGSRRSSWPRSGIQAESGQCARHHRADTA